MKELTQVNGSDQNIFEIKKSDGDKQQQKHKHSGKLALCFFLVVFYPAFPVL